MKKTIVILLLVLSQQLGFSQNCQDSVLFSIHYIASFKNTVEDAKVQTEEKVLDVMQGHTDFYGRWQRKREELTDSILKAGGQFGDVQQAIGVYPRPRQFYSVLNNYPQKGERMIMDKLLYPYYSIESTENINWQLEDNDSVIAEYPCHSASCTFRGHKWDVYYTTDIPYSVGPWKLFGLPGAIMYAKDNTGIFVFEAIEVRNGNKRIYKKPNLQKTKKCTSEEIKKLKVDFYKDPDGFVRRIAGQSVKGYDAKGKTLLHKAKTALFMED